MLDRSSSPLTAVPGPTLPVARLLHGQRIEEAAALLPRIFNLCAATQEVAARMAFGLPLRDAGPADLATGIARDHELRLGVFLPSRLGLDGIRLQELSGGVVLPETPDGFGAFLRAGQGVGALLARVADLFAPGEGCVPRLPVPGDEMAMRREACENSPAMRHFQHPVLQKIQDAWGRGPLWRVYARVLDWQASKRGQLPAPRIARGAAIVPASRGQYAVTAQVRDGRVQAFARVTPTDHMLAPGGLLELSLASLPADKHGLAPLLVDILDPCTPVHLKGGADHA